MLQQGLPPSPRNRSFPSQHSTGASAGPRGPEKETPIRSFDSLRGAKLELISAAAVTGFLSGAVSAVSSSSALMGLLMFHLAVCLEITFWQDSLPGKRCYGHYLSF